MNNRHTVICSVVLVFLFLWCSPASGQKTDPKSVRNAQITSSTPEKAASIIGGTGKISAIKGNQVTIEAVNDMKRKVTIQVRNASMLRVGDQVTIRGNVLSTIPTTPGDIRPPSAAPGPSVPMPGSGRGGPAAPGHKVDGVPAPGRIADEIPGSQPVDPSTGRRLAPIPSGANRVLPGTPGAERMDGGSGDTKDRKSGEGSNKENALENAFGSDMSGVKVHGDDEGAAQKLGESAFGSGANTNLGSVDKDSSAHEWTVAHEAAHVTQKPGGPNPDDAGSGEKSAMGPAGRVGPGHDLGPAVSRKGEKTTKASGDKVAAKVPGPKRPGSGPDPGPGGKSSVADGETVTKTPGPRWPGSDPNPGPGIRESSAQATGGKGTTTATGPRSPGPDPGPPPTATKSAQITKAPNNLNSIVGNQAKVIAVKGNQVTLQQLNDPSRKSTIQVNDASMFKVGQQVNINGNMLTPQAASRTATQGAATMKTPAGRGPGPDPGPVGPAVKQMR